jgi:hypothetical protein
VVVVAICHTYGLLATTGRLDAASNPLSAMSVDGRMESIPLQLNYHASVRAVDSEAR